MTATVYLFHGFNNCDYKNPFQRKKYAVNPQLILR